jgi:hypothetical protein
MHALRFRSCKDSLDDCDRIVESVEFRGGAVVVQCVNDKGCGQKADSKVEEDAAGDKGQRQEQGRGLKEVTNLAHVGGEAWWSSPRFYTPHALPCSQVGRAKLIKVIFSVPTSVLQSPDDLSGHSTIAVRRSRTTVEPPASISLEAEKK